MVSLASIGMMVAASTAVINIEEECDLARSGCQGYWPREWRLHRSFGFRGTEVQRRGETEVASKGTASQRRHKPSGGYRVWGPPSSLGYKAGMTALAVLAVVPLNVMSFNIRYGTANDGANRWEVRRERALSVLQKRRPDLLGVQEALDFQVDELAKAGGYVPVGVGRDDGKAAGEYSAILYDPKRLRLLRSDTFWLSPTPEAIGSKGWGNNITRICTWAYFRDLKTGGTFYHFNTHLDHESQPSRERGIALILTRIAQRTPTDPVIVTGDFNTGEANPVQVQMREAGFRDTFRELHPEVKDVVTFNGWREQPTGDKIDYIFVQGGAKTTHAEIVRDRVDGFWPSDHMPVIATVELPAGS
ncbi:endonuclease/exonuclease/phosphatase family protein [bacterium]|nr:MAG: endonuclease/exonuclease/phosphatase family protein [bacterium]